MIKRLYMHILRQMLMARGINIYLFFHIPKIMILDIQKEFVISENFGYPKY